MTTLLAAGEGKTGADGATGGFSGAGMGTAAGAVDFTGAVVTGCSAALEAGCGDGLASFDLRHMGFSPSVGDFLGRGVRRPQK
ncbi:MAG: hypothetical protein ABSA57_00870 [Candidatus Acidiferrales bacterium]